MPTLPDPSSGLNLPAPTWPGGRWPHRIAMTDSTRTPDPLGFAEGLPPGTALIYRHYLDPDRREIAHRLVEACRRRRIPVLVAGDPRLAVSVRASGFHLPEEMVRNATRQWRLWRRQNWLVTAAAHSRAAIETAHRAGVDAVLLSPVFATESHPDVTPLGPLRFAALCRDSPVPIYALGGIRAETARRLKNSPIRGIAGIGGFQRGGDS